MTGLVETGGPLVVTEPGMMGTLAVLAHDADIDRVSRVAGASVDLEADLR